MPSTGSLGGPGATTLRDVVVIEDLCAAVVSAVLPVHRHAAGHGTNAGSMPPSKAPARFVGEVVTGLLEIGTPAPRHHFPPVPGNAGEPDVFLTEVGTRAEPPRGCGGADLCGRHVWGMG